jgi:tubulin---tyrosine ligase
MYSILYAFLTLHHPIERCLTDTYSPGPSLAIKENAYASKAASEGVLVDRCKPPPTAVPKTKIFAHIAYEDAYVQPLILASLKHVLGDGYILIPRLESASATTADCLSLAKIIPREGADILQITAYEAIDFEFAASHPRSCLVNSYMIRKALTRKHYLSATVDNWVAKNPDSVLKTHVKRSEAFEVDYAEFLDDALVEAWDLKESLERNVGGSVAGHEARSSDEDSSTVAGKALPAEEREWWILKPGMSDRGQGIRLFSTMEELQAIFDGWEAELPDSDDENEDEQKGEGEDLENEGNAQSPEIAEDEDEAGAAGTVGDYIMTSHLRHFVAQPYIHPPLLLAGDNRKFHIRTYVLALGSVKVYVYRNMLVLFAGKAYKSPHSSSSSSDLVAHLTNTCLQGAQDGNINSNDDGAKGGSSAIVRRFWDPELGLESDLQESIFAQICDVTGEVFEAAARGMAIHFQTLPNAFEVFGIDFLVDAEGTAWLLEVNAFPDFKQTGADLRDVVAEFWTGVLRLAVWDFYGIGAGLVDKASYRRGEEMVLVRELDLGRR